jgi:aspartate/methionine/tyrosine aminotransferase
MPNPFYPVYQGSGLLAHGEPVPLPAARATGFLPDLDALEPKLLERTALFFLCTPANPQGVAADFQYLQRAIALARQYGFVLAVDECYAEIYDQAAPAGALQAAAGMSSAGGVFDGLLVFHSLSKWSNAAGLRSGFVAGDPRLIEAFTRLRSYAAAGTPLPALAAATALWRD